MRTAPRVYLKTPNAPGQRAFLRCAASFFLEIRQYSCEKMSCATQKSLAAGHIMSFQIHPKNMIVGLCHFKSCHVINTEKGQQSNERKTVSISGRKRLSTEETVQINAVRTAGKVQRNRNSADARADGVLPRLLRCSLIKAIQTACCTIRFAAGRCLRRDYRWIAVPVLPSMPSLAFSRRVMRAVRSGLDSANLTAASTFGSMEPGAN